MRKRMSFFQILGILGILSGLIMANLHAIPRIIAIVMVSVGSASVAVFIAKRGGVTIRDEMVTRIDALSGNYTCIATLYLIFALSIINFFFPLPLSIDNVFLIMMLFISLSYLMFRYIFLKRGIAE